MKFSIIEAIKQFPLFFTIQTILPGIMILCVGLYNVNEKYKDYKKTEKENIENQKNTKTISEVHEMLEKKNKENSDLKLKINSLEKKTNITKLKFIKGENKKLESGKYQFSFDIHPIGENYIPEFKSIFQTQDNTKIIEVKFIGRDIPSLCNVQNINPGTQIILYRNFPPRSFKIIVITEKITNLNFNILSPEFIHSN